MSAAIVLAKFGDLEKLIPAVAQLESCPPVTGWNAVDGHVHLVISVSENSSTLPICIRNLVGLSHMEAYDVAGVLQPMRDLPLDHVSAYLFIDTEPSKKALLADLISRMPEVVSCASVSGGCDLVVVLSAESITALGKIIDDKIRPMDGILRLKHNHIIDLKKL